MSENYYRTGQAAKQLGLSSYQIRRLCECGLIDAELTNGRQWRIPVSQVARLRKEGVPPIPQSVNDEEQPPQVMLLNHSPNGYQPDVHGSGRPASQPLYSPPSANLIQSAEQVAITGNLVKKRRLEREFEEVEDFFRDRERNQRAELVAERRRAAEIVAEQNRRVWRDGWLRYALDSAPEDAPKGIELNIHRAVEDTLTKLDPDQPEDLVGQLVDAAVESALIPWQHARARESALDTALASLPWGIQYGSEFSDLKQRALRLATEALDGQPQSGTDWELQDVARQAIQPAIEEYEHLEACERTVASLNLPGATIDELEDARAATRESLAQLPIGTTQRRLDQARELALAPIQTRIASREEENQRQRTLELRRSRAELTANFHLGHVQTYLQEAFEFDGGYLELSEEADRLQVPIRKRLVELLTQDPNLDVNEIRGLLEDWVDQLLD